MSHSSFQVIYDGPALAGSLIDVRDLAPALLAFGDVIEQANATINDGQAKVTLKVSASFKSGCFGIDFAVVQGLLDQALDLFKGTPIASAKELTDYLGFFKDVGSGVVFAGGWAHIPCEVVEKPQDQGGCFARKRQREDRCR